ncbi:UNVERIFIED_CONTAM: hypothetical protein RMT77_017773 [Armadillidium vulgare]
MSIIFVILSIFQCVANESNREELNLPQRTYTPWDFKSSTQNCHPKTKYFYRSTKTVPLSTKFVTKFLTRTEKLLEERTKVVTETVEFPRFETKTVFFTHTDAILYSVTNYVTTTRPCGNFQYSKTFYRKRKNSSRIVQ